MIVVVWGVCCLCLFWVCAVGVVMVVVCLVCDLVGGVYFNSVDYF